MMNNVNKEIPTINAFALTGGIGSGKSTVLNLFKKEGFIIFNGDKLVVDLYQNNHSSYQSIAKEFDDWLGTDFSSQLQIDKKKLRSILEVTPEGFPKSAELVKKYFIQECIEISHHRENVMIEVPLLFETKMNTLFKNAIVVTAEENIRFERIKLRNPDLSEQQIKQIISSQLLQDEFLPLANYIIDNSTTIEALELQVKMVAKQLSNNMYISSKIKV